MLTHRKIHKFRKQRISGTPAIPGRNSSSGFTLVEVAIAMAIVATETVFVLGTIAGAQSQMFLAHKLSLATVISRAKVTQLLSGRELEVTDTKGEFGDQAGLYADYSYELKISEEQIDLANVTASGELDSSSPPLEDHLPAGVQNQQQQESLGTSERSATGGLIDVFHIFFQIQYPIGRSGQTGEYTVQTYKENRSVP